MKNEKKIGNKKRNEKFKSDKSRNSQKIMGWKEINKRTKLKNFPLLLSIREYRKV